MALSSQAAVDQAGRMLEVHQAEREQLNTVRRYWRGRQPLPAVIPTSAPREVRHMARVARVNVCSIVIDTLAQSLFVDGYRAQGDEEDSVVWDAWQANRMDARQTGIHRAALAYRAAYAVVLPGDSAPVIRGVSPRSMTALYGEDPDWPMWAFERCGGNLWKLYDDEAVHYLEQKDDGGQSFEFLESREHDLGVVPVVRFLDEEDLDAEDEPEPVRQAVGEAEVPTGGQVAPLMPLQDQIDLTTFSLLVAQHYSAFRQRYAIGWVAEDETEKMKASASQLWTFDKAPEGEDGMKLGEFSQTDLKGYIESREMSIKYAATLSQTPVHELIGELVNLSAEALAAAEAGRDRKVDERQTLLGEAHEQVFSLVGAIQGVETPDDAEVRWRDTSARAFAATVDALGKMTQMLGIPVQELWERVPGATRQDVQRWKAAAAEGDSFQVLSSMLEQQAAEVPAPPTLTPVPEPPAAA